MKSKPKILDAVKPLIAQGETIGQIQRKLGHSRYFILMAARELGIKIKFDRRPSKQSFKIRKLSSEGVSSSELSKRFKLSRQRINQIIHPERHNARKAFWKAFERGKIGRPKNCEMCGETCTPEGHHKDYSKPLEVVFLCKECHSKSHTGENYRKAC